MRFLSGVRASNGQGAGAVRKVESASTSVSVQPVQQLQR